MQKEGHKPAQIGRVIGKPQSFVDDRIALTRLAPEIEEMIAPKRRKNRTLSLVAAAKLGKLEVPDFIELDLMIDCDGISEDLKKTDIEELAGRADGGDVQAQEELRYFGQRLLLWQAQQNAKTAQGIERFLNKRMTKMPSHHKNKKQRQQRFVPIKRWHSLLKMLDSLKQDPVFDWSEHDWSRIVHNLSAADVTETANIASSVADDLAALAKLLQAIADRSKQGNSVVDDMIRTSYVGSDGYRRENVLVPRSQYVELWNKNLLGFQIDNLPKPSELPDISEVEKSLEEAA